MSLRWDEEKIKGFRSPVKKAETDNEWSWWALFATLIIMEVLVILKILGKI